MSHDHDHTAPPGPGSADVVVIGGGIVGLTVADHLQLAGATVVVCDPDPGEGASRAAAGMLAPVTEAEATNPELVHLGMASAARWPALADELGVELGAGTLVVGVDDGDRRALDDLAGLHRDMGLPSRRCSGREAHDLEPLVHPRLRAALDVPGDRSVDPRAAVAALRGRLGSAVCTTRVTGLRPGGGVHTDRGDLVAGTVVVAAGAASPALGLPAVPVRPVKGQILRLRGAPGELPTRTVRALVRGSPVYLVSRPSGELVVGATMEEVGWDASVTGGGLHDLLRDAIEVLPLVRELELVEVLARHRPATPDNGPLLGPSALENVVLATGHHRNGVLLAPITAEAVAAWVAGGAVPAEVEPWTPGRFQ